MTNQRAIDLISRNKSVFQHDDEMTEALNLAIKVLSIDIDKEIWNKSNELLEKRMTYLGGSKVDNEMVDLDACCDNCKFYNWYHSKCVKWGEMTDYRSVCDNYEKSEDTTE